ncbi:LamG domain-containing protein [Ornithinimicrobium sufpigmenti]|uniref:LamG domain-containing protein n=1 Tax=Ornithinimicrobium sufpigmenti TaxID=2508882 RepID=UPI001036C817|nr:MULTISPECIES: LamG domain-containing protein [unclassified Ornithinimicrobium]
MTGLRSFSQRVTAMMAVVATVLATILVTVAGASAAQAAISPIAPRGPQQVTADALPTAQINGIAWSQAIVGNTVYAGGRFTHARPPGAAPGTNQTPRGNLLSYNLTTGQLTGFSPDLNAQVLAVSAAPDGSRVYVGGDFSAAQGQNRGRIAAYDTASGQLTDFRPAMTGQVKTIVATDDVIYVGGSFQSVGGVSRTHLAAFDTEGNLLNWNPVLDRPVWGLALSEDGQHVIAGGEFETVNGVRQRGLAKLDAVTGELQQLPYQVSNGGPDAAVTSVSVDGDWIYGTTYHFGPGGNLEGPFKVNVHTGETGWVNDCHGDTYSQWVAQDAVYFVGHPHYCGNVSLGFPQYSSWKYQHTGAVTKEATGENIREVHGYANWAGTPSPSTVHWFPTMSMGSVSGAYQAGWHITGNSEYVTVAGEFPRVNGAVQEGLVRFAVAPIAPQNRGPQFLDNSLIPDLQPVADGAVKVSWMAGYDMDDESLTYQVVRTPGGMVREFSASSAWWRVPGLSHVDTDLTPGQTYSYQVRVIDSSGNRVFGANRQVTVPTTVPRTPYGAAVLDDGPELYWPLDDTSGTSTITDHAGGFYGVPGSGVTYTVAGAIPDSTAVSVANNNNGRIYARGSHIAPVEFSAEAWFRSSATSGRLLGFGDLQTGNSGHRDRSIYLGNSGRVHFGLQSDGAKVVASPSSYNNNQWHHVVATLSGQTARLYVDGVLVGARHDITNPEEYVGHWRAGGDSQSGWPNGGNANFTGAMDEIAIYPHALTPQQVNAHYVASGRASLIPERPADTYGQAVFDHEPNLYWRLAETSGTTAGDAGSMLNNGTYRGGHTLNQPGALAGVDNPAVTFNGSSGYVSSNTQFLNPQVFSTEAWFKTSTTRGGKIIGFGNQQASLSSTYDRHVYMADDGRLIFGVYTGVEERITTAGTYNDGSWHHMVATLSEEGMRLYVDGALVGTNPTSRAESFNGYWRVGGDRVWSGATSAFFDGTIDEVAVYSQPLTLEQVQHNYTTGSGQVPNVPPVASFESVASHLAVAFDASASQDPDGQVASYDWSFGDGATASGVTPTHTYAESGTYPVTLVVTDDDGATHTSVREVTVVANVPPMARFGVESSFLQAGFDASASSDEDGSIVEYLWDFGDGSAGSGVVTGHTYDEPGTYLVTLQVRDDDGAVHSTSAEVTVAAKPPNQAPAAEFSHEVTALLVSVDASASEDPDGDIVSYEWGFGDGATGTGLMATHTYAAAGTYEVSLVVTDDEGASALSSVSVTVQEPPQNQAPTAQLTVSVSDLTVSVDGSESLDTDGQVVAYDWDFGDGEQASGQTASHTYAAAGTYTVTLSVTDDDGATGTAQEQVEVSAPPVNQAPQAAFSWSATGLTATVDASGSTDSDGVITAYEWDFGDDAEGEGEVAMHSYGSAGSYAVTLTVTDDAGATGSVTHQVVVQAPPPVNQPPTAQFTHQTADLTVAVDAAGSADPDGTIGSYVWEFGDGSTASGVAASHTYAAGGNYTITLTVVDDDGASAEVTAQVVVTSGAQTFVTDTFSRTLANGFGTADLGGSWTTTRSSSLFSVSDGKGHIRMSAPGSGPNIFLQGPLAVDLDATVDVTMDKDPTGGGTYNSLVVRRIANNDYQLKVRALPDHVQILLTRTVNGAESTLSSTTVPIVYRAGDTLRLRVVADGSGTTSLTGKAWVLGTPEPAAWQVQATDTTAALQGAGGVGLISYLSGSSTNAPVTSSWDNLHVGSTQEHGQENEAQ